MAKGIKTGGRAAGVPNKKTAETQKAVAESGITPLDFMLQVMRKEPPENLEPKEWYNAFALRFEAAKAAAPYIHPRLAAIEHSGGVTLKTLAETLAELNGPDSHGG